MSWLIDKSAFSRLHLALDVAEWANRIERGLVRISRQRPVVYHPLFGVLAAAFAALDFVRRPFAKTSQMFFVLEHDRTTQPG